ncbi:hypothetical protein [Bradyrhizobium elkanii]|jgi:hypothetical protein|uniref:hypothetical protein n=1 Tax=Bradyrhizobium elkanii TaxID=29448 RepID=UPI0027146680|nr:hypothetical protein [Bradyrhizobium elkanii]WLB05143.1 hypothetical protein QNJ80_45135 [Bradyrhizobium elkanii]
MVWGRKNNSAPPPIPAKPERSPDELISEMLNAYQEHSYTQQKNNSRPGIDEAKAKIDRARRLIEDGRIGYSLCAISDHIRPWHAWALRDDFQQYAGFPATAVSGFKERLDDRGLSKRTTTQFTYRAVPYTLVWKDEGSPLAAMDDYKGYGKIRLYEAGRLIVGIEVSCDRSRGIEYERWHFTNVIALDPGDWMKHVVEMAAHLDASRTNYRNSFLEDDAIERASKINL